MYSLCHLWLIDIRGERMIPEYIQKFADELQFENGLEPQTPGVYLIPFDDDINVKLTVLAPQGFALDANIASCPPGNKEQLFSNLLLGNLFAQGTRGAIIGLNEDGNMLTLSKAVEYNVDYKVFKETLEDFVTTIDFWREQARAQKIV